MVVLSRKISGNSLKITLWCFGGSDGLEKFFENHTLDGLEEEYINFFPFKWTPTVYNNGL